MNDKHKFDKMRHSERKKQLLRRNDIDEMASSSDLYGSYGVQDTFGRRQGLAGHDEDQYGDHSAQARILSVRQQQKQQHRLKQLQQQQQQLQDAKNSPANQGNENVDPDYYDDYYYGDLDEAGSAGNNPVTGNGVSAPNSAVGAAASNNGNNLTPKQKLLLRQLKIKALLGDNYDYDYGGSSGADVTASGFSGLGTTSATASALGSSGTGLLLNRNGGGGGYGSGGNGQPGGESYLYAENDCDNGINPFLALTVLGGLGAATYVIYTYLTQNGRRSHEGGLGNDDDGLIVVLADMIISSMSIGVGKEGGTRGRMDKGTQFELNARRSVVHLEEVLQ
jgi:hypothetical protein